jgi:hypothetical protein
MDIEHILIVFNRHEVRYLLIGGMNFLLQHKPVLTFDVDFWIEDTDSNRDRCESALSELNAEWGHEEADWGPVSSKPKGWLAQQSVFCLTSPHGAIDIFRRVQGLADWSAAFSSAVSGSTAEGTAYLGLSDSDMLTCQLSIPEEYRKIDRIHELRKALQGNE